MGELVNKIDELRGQGLTYEQAVEKIKADYRKSHPAKSKKPAPKGYITNRGPTAVKPAPKNNHGFQSLADALTYYQFVEGHPFGKASKLAHRHRDLVEDFMQTATEGQGDS